MMGNELERLASIEAQMKALTESNGRLEKMLADSVTRLERRFEGWQDTHIPRSEIEAISRAREIEIQVYAADVAELKGHVIWLWRTVLSAIIVGFTGGGITLVWAIVKAGGGVG